MGAGTDREHQFGLFANSTNLRLCWTDPNKMSDSPQETPVEDSVYEHGEEILLGGSKKLIIVSRTEVLDLPLQSYAWDHLESCS